MQFSLTTLVLLADLTVAAFPEVVHPVVWLYPSSSQAPTLDVLWAVLVVLPLVDRIVRR
jgi:hypothetical protein